MKYYNEVDAIANNFEEHLKLYKKCFFTEM